MCVCVRASFPAKSSVESSVLINAPAQPLVLQNAACRQEGMWGFPKIGDPKIVPKIVGS